MATVKYLLQSKSNSANIYLRYSIDRKTVLKRKTGFVINPTDWSEDKGFPKTGSEDLKALKSKLEKLSTYIKDAHNESVSTGQEFTSAWLVSQIDSFNNKTPIIELNVFTTYIQKYIDESPYKQNQKNELGLSNGRVQNLKLFKKTILKYEFEVLNSKKILLKEINLAFLEKFKMWMFGKGYSIEYVGKKLG